VSEPDDRDAWHEVFQEAKGLHQSVELFETVVLGLANPGELPDAAAPAEGRRLAHHLYGEIVQYQRQLERLMAVIPAAQ
jgi:hypothetical protein